MNVQLDSDFTKKLKKQRVLVRKNFKERIIIFSKDPDYPKLNNHPLREKWEGYRSIDITDDWRAIYKEIRIRGEIIAYFVAIGTHEELYR